MRPGTEETAVTRLNIPVNKEVKLLMGLSAKTIAKNGARIEFDLSDEKSKGVLVVSPAPDNVSDFRPRGQPAVPIVGINLALETKDPYLITVKKTNGEIYASVGEQVSKGQLEYSQWKRVAENADQNTDNQTPHFSSLEVQAAGFTFHRPSQRIIGEKGWQ
ncbi:MAG: hypothetical protein UU23_C0001G0039 [Candidatus Curtissbacteria bacterium GW2011_GWA1_40_9]|uniref:Uncharacterized protein n=1 Tax=Candidatus Curtissbacteria bacterium GW2011_GWA1_40_9 TaxID=1618408 RepID=A0A0G0W1V6_9BACT|nr:MAG: hypothetical protein UU23_C0001G0039 [Candidatus Curtissbacteria bacterium GW2011_GWA1_40_9]